MGNRLFGYSFSQLILRQDPPKSSTFDHFPLPPRKRLSGINLEAFFSVVEGSGQKSNFLEDLDAVLTAKNCIQIADYP